MTDQKNGRPPERMDYSSPGSPVCRLKEMVSFEFGGEHASCPKGALLYVLAEWTHSGTKKPYYSVRPFSSEYPTIVIPVELTVPAKEFEATEYQISRTVN